MRGSAYRALAQYPLDLLELLELLPPLRQYAELLLREQEAEALLDAGKLLQEVLQHEHARRRRCADVTLW